MAKSPLTEATVSPLDVERRYLLQVSSIFFNEASRICLDGCPPVGTSNLASFRIFVEEIVRTRRASPGIQYDLDCLLKRWSDADERCFDGGNPKCESARILCLDCGAERLLMFSCKTRDFFSASQVDTPLIMIYHPFRQDEA